MNSKRTGFTLSEVLIALVIMGFITSVAIPVIQTQKTAYTSLAYYAHENLKNITSEIINAETQGNVSEDKAMTKVTGGPSDFEERLIKNDYELSDNGTSLCDYMNDIMNTQGSFNCNTGKNQFTYRDALEYRLKVPSTPNITTTNGQKYYIGFSQPGEINDVLLPDGTTESVQGYGYRIVLVDLNGEALPNSIEKKKDSSLPPDIIAFAILDSGEVLPVGTAANNTSVKGKHYDYLTSKIHGYTYTASKAALKGSIPEFCTNTKSGTPRCSYSKQAVKNNTSSGIKFTYRQAYCSVNHAGSEVKLKDYCNGIVANPLCPPSGDGNAYDTCKQEVIKPMFRFNFR